LGAVCAKQVGHWQTEESLWRHVTTESPRQLRPQIQLARAVEPGECLRLLEPWEQRLPDEYAIPAEMGRCALQMGDAPRALRHFGRALALRPNDVAAKQNRDAALKALGIAVR
jgi:tetratricopeptide (TPR) repeat protein